MKADRRRRGRAIRKARRQVTTLKEFFDTLREAIINTAKFIADCGRAFIQMGRELFTLWPPRPKTRTIIHNGRKP